MHFLGFHLQVHVAMCHVVSFPETVMSLQPFVVTEL